MASGSYVSNPLLPTGPPLHEFRGHPQPPVDERLTAAFNFLADEDPDRCLDFASRIKEVEDYVEHVDNQNIPCSTTLLNDVKVMAAAHRDWEKRRADGPRDVTCNDNVRAPISTRLISAETAAGLRSQRDAADLNARIREDYTPFSINRESDHTAFIRAMDEDAKVDPDELDPISNLLVAESQAYGWALQDPIMIPTWMHPTQGIPKKGVSAADPTPWYRISVPDPIIGSEGIKEEFIKSYMQRYATRTPGQLQVLKKDAREADGDIVDFTGKAERRGIQRASIELALNLLATNQEQHRPGDRFRVMDLTRQYIPLEKEISISLPLEPSRRQIENDHFEYTKKMIAFRKWKDFDYSVARDRLVQDTSSTILYPPINYNGPIALANTADDMEVARDRHVELSRIALRLSNAYANAPRPILRRMLQLVTEGMDRTLPRQHEYYDEVPLNKSGLDVLEEISGDSWHDGVQEHLDPLLGFSHNRTKYAQERDQLAEFEKDIAEMDDLPLWVPVQEDQDIGGNEANNYRQTLHDPAVASRHGLSLTEILLQLGKMRATRADGRVPARFLSEEDIGKFLVAMKQSGKIHYDENPGHQLASRIPLDGHPENKYVLSRIDASISPGVRADAKGTLYVQYNASGLKGRPIVQPNKIDFLQRLAFRLGRDTLRVLERLQKPVVNTNQGGWAAQDVSRRAAQAAMAQVTPEDRGQDAVNATVALDSITIQRLAREANAIGPHHAMAADISVDDTLSDRDAAAIIQMKILEESSHSLEPKFREKENVWDFASDRLLEETQTVNGRKITVKPRITQYFSMRRFPVCCQSEATRTAIARSGPILEEKTATPAAVTRTQVRQRNQRGRKVRHIRGQAPYYPFGETPYQEAYQSHLIEYELRDVPEFQPPPRRSFFNPFGRATARPPIVEAPEPEEDLPIPNDPYPLPKIPPGWKPENISMEEKRLQVTEIARNTPGFPNRAIPEYYYTQEEIENHRVMQEYAERARAVQAATDATEMFTRKKYAALSMQELRNAQTELNIDPRTGMFLPDANVTTGRAAAAAASPAPTASRTPWIGSPAPTGGTRLATTQISTPVDTQIHAPSVPILPAESAVQFGAPSTNDFLSQIAQDEAQVAVDLRQDLDVPSVEDLENAASVQADVLGLIAEMQAAQRREVEDARKKKQADLDALAGKVDEEWDSLGGSAPGGARS